MKDHSKLTLAELEALAARMEHAARTMREAMAIVNGGAAVQTSGVVTTHQQPMMLNTPERREYNEQLEAKKAERKAFLASMRGSPERAAKLNQFAHDGGDDKDAAVSVEELERLSGE